MHITKDVNCLSAVSISTFHKVVDDLFWNFCSCPALQQKN